MAQVGAETTTQGCNGTLISKYIVPHPCKNYNILQGIFAPIFRGAKMKKCINKRCHKDLSDDFVFCPYCGKNQTDKPKRQPKRANGTGSIYYRKDSKTKPWYVASTITGKRVYVGGFATRTEAVKALTDYESAPTSNINITFAQLHERWLKTKAYQKLSDDAKSSYNAAWVKLRSLYNRKFRDLKTFDFQAIVDYYENPHHEEGAGGKLKYLLPNGKGTYKITDTPKMCDGLKFSALHKIKVFLTKIYKYAMEQDIVAKNYAEFIELPEPEEVNATRFTEVQLELLRQNIGKVPYADYAYIMCYLNFRVSEFLTLTIEQYHVSEQGIPYFIAGIKSEAGKNRLIPIHPKIQKMVTDCINHHGETIFCRLGDDFGKSMNKDYFLKYAFRPAMQAMGLGNEFTPHSCRRTFSTRMSAAGAREEDIIALMGHAEYKTDINHYIVQELDTLYDAVKKLA